MRAQLDVVSSDVASHREGFELDVINWDDLPAGTGATHQIDPVDQDRRDTHANQNYAIGRDHEGPTVSFPRDT